MDLRHFTGTPLERVRDTPNPVNDEELLRSFAKPRGLWVSVKGPDDWPTWCRESDLGDWVDGKLEYRVELAKGANVLEIPTPEDLDAFVGFYGASFRWGAGDRWEDHYINWAKVARAYDGIIIAPYHWSRRLGDRTRFYYSWDCASGCIWRARAVASVELLRGGK